METRIRGPSLITKVNRRKILVQPVLVEGAKRPHDKGKMSQSKRWLPKWGQLFEALKEARRHMRLPATFHATLSGPFGLLEVTGIDVHRNGAGVKAEEALAKGTLVYLRIAEYDLAGFAHVKHCSPYEGGYRLGLEFREQLAHERGESFDWNRRSVARDAYRPWDETEA